MTRPPSPSTPSAVGSVRWDANATQRQEPVDHRRRRRRQRLARPPLETRTAEACRRSRRADHRMPPAARHKQMEPRRAPLVRLHHRQLARQAPDQPCRHRPIDRSNQNQGRPRSPMRTRPPTLILPASKSRTTILPLSISPAMTSTPNGTTRFAQKPRICSDYPRTGPLIWGVASSRSRPAAQPHHHISFLPNGIYCLLWTKNLLASGKSICFLYKIDDC